MAVSQALSPPRGSVQTGVTVEIDVLNNDPSLSYQLKTLLHIT